MPWPTGCGPAAPGGCCPMTCRPGRPSTTTFAAGGNRACGSRSTGCCMSRSGPGKADGPHPARPSWTARASRPPNGGAPRLRRRQEAQRPQAPPAGRHPRTGLHGPGDRRRRGRPRRRHGVAQTAGPAPVPRLRHGWADGGYRGPFLDWARETRGIAFQLVSRSDGGRKPRWLPPGATPPIVSPFAVVPRRWVVERTFAWLGRYRRLSKDYEFLTATSEAVIYLAMTRLLVRRLTAHEPFSDTLYPDLGCRVDGSEEPLPDGGRYVCARGSGPLLRGRCGWPRLAAVPPGWRLPWR
jgi:transposase